MVLDHLGKSVVIGSKVKLLRLDPKVAEHLPATETQELQAMVNDCAEVYDIRSMYICIEKSWEKKKGRIVIHRISVLSKDIEFIS